MDTATYLQEARTAGPVRYCASFAQPRGICGSLAGIVMAFTNARLNAWTVDQLSIASTDTVLDVGFGPGVGVKLASYLALEGKVFGVDASKTMLRQATHRNGRGIARGAVDLRLGDANRLPFADASIDKAFSVNTAQYLPDIDAALREIHRVLRPSGVAAVSIQRIHRRDGVEDLHEWARRIERAMQSAGFETVSDSFFSRLRLPSPGAGDDERMLCVTGRKAS